MTGVLSIEYRSPQCLEWTNKDSASTTRDSGIRVHSQLPFSRVENAGNCNQSSRQSAGVASIDEACSDLLLSRIDNAIVACHTRPSGDCRCRSSCVHSRCFPTQWWWCSWRAFVESIQFQQINRAECNSLTNPHSLLFRHDRWLSIFAEGRRFIVHNGAIVVGHCLIRDVIQAVFLEVIFHIGFDIVPVNVDELISIRSALFMEETGGVHELVHDYPPGQTTITNWHYLTTPLTTHTGIATVFWLDQNVIDLGASGNKANACSSVILLNRRSNHSSGQRRISTGNYIGNFAVRPQLVRCSNRVRHFCSRIHQHEWSVGTFDKLVNVVFLDPTNISFEQPSFVSRYLRRPCRSLAWQLDDALSSSKIFLGQMYLGVGTGWRQNQWYLQLYKDYFKR